MNQPLAVSITEASQVGEARRLAAGLTRELGFDATAAGTAAVVVTEAATNLVKHGQGGDLLLRVLHDNGTPAIEMLALDKGPGMADVSHALRDGYSTSSSPGTGLGAIARLARTFDVYSVVGQGTALLAQVAARPTPEGEHPLEVGAVSVPKPGEVVCGDSWALRRLPDGGRVLVADGLGHGPAADEAARAAARAFEAHPTAAPADLMHALHAALRSTRGATAAVAELSLAEGQVRYAGVGNINGLLHTEAGTRHMVSHTGTLGHQLHTVTEFTYPWTPDTTLIMFSDGLTSQVSLDKYPGLLARHVSLIAGVLYRDFARGRDDATVVVVRERQAGGLR